MLISIRGCGGLAEFDCCVVVEGASWWIAWSTLTKGFLLSFLLTFLRFARSDLRRAYVKPRSIIPFASV